MLLSAFAGAVFGAIIAPIAIPIIGTLIYFAQESLKKVLGKKHKASNEPQFIEV